MYFYYSKIGILVEELLFEILYHLSCTYLDIKHCWPGGTDMFRNQMIWSFKDLPKTPKDICLILMNNKTSADVKYTIIIFMYFYFLTSSK